MKLYPIHGDVKPDARDEEIALKREAAWNKRPGPRVGDFVIMPDGETERFSHDWGDDIQTTDGKYGASFYLGDGFASMSGGLNPAIPKDKIVDTGKTKDGSFWFFHHDFSTAFNGVGVSLACRVFKYQERGEP